jgi:hypothetical protein
MELNNKRPKQLEGSAVSQQMQPHHIYCIHTWSSRMMRLTRMILFRFPVADAQPHFLHPRPFMGLWRSAADGRILMDGQGF